MVTRPNSPASKGREELVKQISSLPAYLLKGMKGGKGAQEVLDIARDLRREGAHPTEIYDETKKFTNPEAETGLYQNPAGQFVFDVPDDASLTPMAENFVKSNFGPGGESPQMQMDRLLRNELLYSYVPELRKTPTTVKQLEPGDDQREAGGTYWPPGSKHAGQSLEGAVEATGRGDLDPNALDMFSTRNIAAHEINHVLQNKFMLPRGGHPDLKELTQFHKATLQPYAQRVSDEVYNEFEDWYDKKGRPEGMNRSRAWEMYARLYPDKYKIASDADRIAVATPETRSADRHFLYEGLAGEESANQASRNLGKTAEQLRSEYPFATSTDAPGLSWPFQTMRFGDSLQHDWDYPEDYFLRNMTVRGPQ